MKKFTAIAILEWFAWSILAGFMSLIFVASFCSLAHSAKVSAGYGTQINWNPSWCSEATTHNVMEVEVHQRVKPWLTVGLVGQRLAATVEPGHIVDGHWYEGSNTTIAFHFRVGLQGIKGVLTGRLFGGFGLHLGHQVEIGDSRVLGHFGAEVGLKLGHATTVSYGLVHMSDPLQHHDFGWNYQMLKIGINF